MKQPIRQKSGLAGPLSMPLLVMHVSCVGVFFVKGGWPAAIICAVMYLLHVFALTAGFHRYFSHKTFKTSRAVQWILAVLGTTAAQRDPLWWASHHRVHHETADTEADTHSPRHYGFWWAHMGWVMKRELMETRFEKIRDFARYPELMWLNRHPYTPPVILAGLLLALGAGLNRLQPGWGVSGPQFLFYGFFLSTVLVYHVTFCINSVSHIIGRQPYETGDDSRNNWVLGLLAMGEGWHNNHHRYAVCTRQGFRWWELDLTYMILRALHWIGVVWGIREPPAALLAERKTA